MTSELYVWIWLPGTTKPVVCGRLWVENEIVRFVYGRSYRARVDAIALMPHGLPLAEQVYSARRSGSLPGALADAAPDAWGRRVIEYRLKSGSLPELEYLARAAGDRIGALHFQTGHARYAPSPLSATTLEDLQQATAALEAHRPLAPELAAALEHGTSIGGARPKAILTDGSRQLVAKFSSSTDRWPVVQVEHACMQLARRCGINVVRTEQVSVAGKDVLLVERFDRPSAAQGGMLHLHMLSALTLLDLDETEARLASYPQLAEVLRQGAEHGRNDAEELFRRMVFNVLIGNTDDHARNHAVFWDGRWLRLAPAYDLVAFPRVGQEAQQAMVVGTDGRTSSVANALSHPGRFGLEAAHAEAIARQVHDTLANEWKAVFRDCGIADGDIQHFEGAAVLSPAACRGL